MADIMPPAAPDAQPPTPSCACGCGEAPSPGRKFITRHNLKVMGERTAEHRRKIGEGQRRAWATTSTRRKPLGSRRKNFHGYWLVKTREGNHRWEKEHVLVIEASIGRKLVPGEQVHHLNAVKDDNQLENLLLCASASDHARIHSSFDALLPELMASGAIYFDHEARGYRCA